MLNERRYRVSVVRTGDSASADATRGAVNLSVSSPQGGICATADAFWGAMERLSRDEHADVRPHCADAVSTNARASYESETLSAVTARNGKIRTRRAIQHGPGGRVPNHSSLRPPA